MTCEICAAQFVPPAAAVRRGAGKTCSVRCRCVKAGRKSGGRSSPGTLNPNYKNGLYVGGESHARNRVHQAVYKAVKRGKLKRQPCERCGASIRVEGHHEDYSKRLEVIWLCRQCHVARHKGVA